jgi:hypothetical protein
MRGRRAAIPPALIALVLGVAGCGGDSSGEASAPKPRTFSIPAVTAPGIAPTTTGKTGGVKPGTTTSKGGKTYNPTAPDSPTNDVPPPPGSPQEAFEKRCEQNPQACG